MQSELIAELIEIRDDHAALGRPRQAKTIQEAISVLEAVPQWVKCSERLPDRDGYFLTADKNNEVGESWYTEECGFRRTEGTSTHDVYWCELPAPPIVEQGEN